MLQLLQIFIFLLFSGNKNILQPQFYTLRINDLSGILKLVSVRGKTKALDFLILVLVFFIVDFIAVIVKTSFYNITIAI